MNRSKLSLACLLFAMLTATLSLAQPSSFTVTVTANTVRVSIGQTAPTKISMSVGQELIIERLAFIADNGTATGYATIPGGTHAMTTVTAPHGMVVGHFKAVSAGTVMITIRYPRRGGPGRALDVIEVQIK